MNEEFRKCLETGIIPLLVEGCGEGNKAFPDESEFRKRYEKTNLGIRTGNLCISSELKTCPGDAEVIAVKYALDWLDLKIRTIGPAKSVDYNFLNGGQIIEYHTNVERVLKDLRTIVEKSQ